MQVSAEFIITNITKYNLKLTTAESLISRTIGRVVVKDSENQYYGGYPLPSGYSSDIQLEFWVIPPFKKEDDSYKSGIIVNDQFGNKYKIKKVQFVYR